jgi:hypothetical protein
MLIKGLRLYQILPVAVAIEWSKDVLKVDADEDGVGGDHAADCLRYLVATKPRTIEQRKLRGL